MLTICYSVLTWLQSRQRQEVLSWITEICVQNKVSLVFTKSRLNLLPYGVTYLTITGAGQDSATKPSNRIKLGSSTAVHVNNSLTSTQVSNLCYNYNNIKRTKLIWEEDENRVLALFPLVNGRLLSYISLDANSN